MEMYKLGKEAGKKETLLDLLIKISYMQSNITSNYIRSDDDPSGSEIIKYNAKMEIVKEIHDILENALDGFDPYQE